MVHKPVPLQKALRDPKGRAALNKEWDKLDNITAWDVSKVQPRAKVVAQAKKDKVPVHFGDIMQLCHIKNSELDEWLQSMKGRIVFRGDGVTDEDGTYAVFTDQGTSASLMAATKFLDLIARLPGNKGEDSDAVSAYTQIKLSEARKLLGTDVLPETYIRLPKNRQPKPWEGIEDPVCPLLRNLYGHPLAGLLWDKRSQALVTKAGFEKVKGWESL